MVPLKSNEPKLAHSPNAGNGMNNSSERNQRKAEVMPASCARVDDKGLEVTVSARVCARVEFRSLLVVY